MAFSTAAKNQDKFCEIRGWPNFAAIVVPNGVCPECRNDIYGENGYTEEYAAKNLITRCPFCGRSFVD